MARVADAHDNDGERLLINPGLNLRDIREA
jgi:hypothetical protein